MPRATSVKTLFGHWAPKFRKSMTYGDRTSRDRSRERRGSTPNAQEDMRQYLSSRDISPSPPVKRNRTPSVLSEGANAEKRKSAIM